MSRVESYLERQPRIVTSSKPELCPKIAKTRTFRMRAFSGWSNKLVRGHTNDFGGNSKKTPRTTPLGWTPADNMPIDALYSKHSLRGTLELPLSCLQIHLCPPPLASVGRKWHRTGRHCDGGCPDNWAGLDARSAKGAILAAMWGAGYSIQLLT